MKKAHEAAIQYAREAGALISFDPNLRFPLWPDRELLYKRVWEFIPQADMIKISDEELEFLTGSTQIESVLEKLLVGRVRLVLFTCGSEGAYAFTRTARAHAKAQKVEAIDTTGAGDAFAGAMLYLMYRDHVTDPGTLDSVKLQEYLEFANRYCAKSVQKKGAIASYPSAEEMA